MSALNNTPPLLGYVLAAALKVSGGGEFATRAMLLPFDLAAAWALLALAARFLRRPLLPALIVLLGPAWIVNMPHLMAERVMAGFALPALWLAAVGADEENSLAWWGSAALAGLALLTKYNALFVPAAAAAYAWSRGVPRRRIAAWLAAAGCGVAAYQCRGLLAGGAAPRAAWSVASEAYGGIWFRPGHLLRSLLCFTGGCGVFVAAAGAALKPGRRAVVLTALASAALFGPWFDLAPLVLSGDRATGFLLAWGTLLTLWSLGVSRRTAGAPLWIAWIAAVAVLQTAYWSVLARFIVFLLPPLVFWAAENLERRADGGRAAIAAGLALTAFLGVAAAAVDWRFAWVEREFARRAAAESAAKGGTLWCASHWGLQEYLVSAGARQLDLRRGGWAAVRPGDTIVLSRVGQAVPPPAGMILRANRKTTTVDFPVPLRLMSGWTGEGGFYSNMMGFLPWSFSSEPLEEFTVLDVL